MHPPPLSERTTGSLRRHFSAEIEDLKGASSALFYSWSRLSWRQRQGTANETLIVLVANAWVIFHGVDYDHKNKILSWSCKNYLPNTALFPSRLVDQDIYVKLISLL